jgi:hypothetical protein
VRRKAAGAVKSVRRAAQKAPGRARQVVQRVQAAASTALDTATQAVATTAGVVVGAVESVLPSSGENKPSEPTPMGQGAVASGESEFDDDVVDAGTDEPDDSDDSDDESDDDDIQ